MQINASATWRTLVAIGLVLQPCWAAAQSTPHLIDPVARLRPGATSGTTALFVRVDTLNKEQRNSPDPELIDQPLLTPMAASVRVVAAVAAPAGGADAGGTWRVDLVVDGLNPASTLQRRYATVKWLGKETHLDYYLSNQAPADFAWDVEALPAEWNLNTDPCISFHLRQSLPIMTGLAAHAALVEETSKQQLVATGLFLTSAATTRPTQQELDEAASRQQPLFLCADATFRESYVEHGKFAGTVRISSTQKPDGKTSALTAYKAGLRSVGILLILLGTVAAYLVKVYVPARLIRNRELEPVALLRNQQQRRLSRIASVPPSTTPIIDAALNTMSLNLSDTSLDGNHLIHRVPPTPFNDNVDTAGFAALLTDRAGKVALISVIVEDGLLRAKALEGTPGAAQAMVDAAYTTMDGRLAQVPVPSLDQMRNLTRTDVADLQQKINSALGPAVALTFAPFASKEVSFERLQLSTETLSGTV